MSASVIVASPFEGAGICAHASCGATAIARNASCIRTFDNTGYLLPAKRQTIEGHTPVADYDQDVRECLRVLERVSFYHDEVGLEARRNRAGLAEAEQVRRDRRRRAKRFEW